ncbi:uncharacterized protein LOC143286886 isoform X2 [Babylonia areolata]|uniref:uncharacterized protein LOC143286886 isoform X2 n=1 Tax=Babylonia areolata TaxID=304850 RepID=UPI003FCFF21B
MSSVEDEPDPPGTEEALAELNTQLISQHDYADESVPPPQDMDPYQNDSTDPNSSFEKRPSGERERRSRSRKSSRHGRSHRKHHRHSKRSSREEIVYDDESLYTVREERETVVAETAEKETEDGEILEDGEIASDEEEMPQIFNTRRSIEDEDEENSEGEQPMPDQIPELAENAEGGPKPPRESRGKRDNKRKRKDKRKDEKRKKARRHEYVDHDQVDEDGGGRWPGYQGGPENSYYHGAGRRRDPRSMYYYPGTGDSPPGLYDSPSDESDEEMASQPSLTSLVSGDFMDASVAASEKEVPHVKVKAMKPGKKRGGGGGGRGRRKDGGRHNEPPKKKLAEIPMAERPVCKFFKDGKCAKGANCPFNHDAPRNKRLECCKFYLTQAGCHKDSCIYMHDDFPCKYYHTGQTCFAGEKCRFSHEPLTEETKKIIEEFLNPSLKEENMDTDRPKKPSLLGSPPRHVLEAMERAKEIKKIPSLFDIEVFPPGQKPKMVSFYSERGDSSSPPSDSSPTRPAQNPPPPPPPAPAASSSPSPSLLGTPPQNSMRGPNPGGMMQQGPPNPMMMPGSQGPVNRPMMGGPRPMYGMQQQGMNPGMQQGMNPNMQQGMNPNMQQGMNPNMQQQGMNPNMMQQNMGPRMGMNPNMEQNPNQGMNQNAQNMPQGMNQNMQQGMNPNVQQNMNPNMQNPNMQQGMNPNIQQQNMNPNMQQQQNMNPNMQQQQNMNPNMQQGMNQNMQQNMNQNMQQGMNQNMQGMNPNMQQQGMNMNQAMQKGMNQGMAPGMQQRMQNPGMMQQGMNPNMQQQGMNMNQQGMNPMQGMMNQRGMNPNMRGMNPNMMQGMNRMMNPNMPGMGMPRFGMGGQTASSMPPVLNMISALLHGSGSGSFNQNGPQGPMPNQGPPMAQDSDMRKKEDGDGKSMDGSGEPDNRVSDESTKETATGSASDVPTEHGTSSISGEGENQTDKPANSEQTGDEEEKAAVSQPGQKEQTGKIAFQGSQEASSGEDSSDGEDGMHALTIDKGSPSPPPQQSPDDKIKAEGGADKDQTLDIAKHLPPMQRQLFMRIRQQQLHNDQQQHKEEPMDSEESPSVEEKTADAKMEEDDNWYSSDEDETGVSKRKLADILKNISQTTVSNTSSTSDTATTTAASSSSSTASTINVMQMIQSIRSQAQTSKPSEESAGTSAASALSSGPSSKDPSQKQSDPGSASGEPVAPSSAKSPPSQSSGAPLPVLPTLFVDPPVIDGIPKKTVVYRMTPLSVRAVKPYWTLPSSVDIEDADRKKDPRVQAHITLVEKRGPEVKAAPQPTKVSDPRLARKTSVTMEEGGLSPRPVDPRVRRSAAKDPRMGPQDPRSQGMGPQDPRSQNMGPQDPRTQNMGPQDPRSQGMGPQDPRSQNMGPSRPDPRMQNAPGQEPWMGNNMGGGGGGGGMMGPGGCGMNMMQGPNNMGPGFQGNMMQGPRGMMPGQGDMWNMRMGSPMNMQQGPMGMQQGPMNMQGGLMGMNQGPMNMPGGMMNMQGGPMGMQQGPRRGLLNMPGPMGMQQGNMNMPPGNMGMQQGNMNMPPGNMGMQQGNMNMPPGNMNMQQGNMNMPPGQGNQPDPRQPPTGNMDPRQELAKQRGPSDPRQGPSDPRQGPSDPRQGPSDPRQGPSDPRQGPSDPRQGPSDPRQGPSDPRQGPSDPRQGPADPRDPRRGFSDPRQRGGMPVRGDPREGRPSAADPRISRIGQDSPQSSSVSPRYNDPTVSPSQQNLLDDPASSSKTDMVQSDSVVKDRDSLLGSGSFPLPQALRELPPKSEADPGANDSGSASEDSASVKRRFDHRNDPRFKRKRVSENKGEKTDSTVESSEERNRKLMGQRKSSMEYASPLGGGDDINNSGSSYNSYNRPPQGRQDPRKRKNVASSEEKPFELPRMELPALLSQEPPPLPDNMTTSEMLQEEPEQQLKDLFKTIDPTASPFC